jgi:hypothetical protein
VFEREIGLSRKLVVRENETRKWSKCKSEDEERPHDIQPGWHMVRETRIIVYYTYRKRALQLVFQYSSRGKYSGR